MDWVLGVLTTNNEVMTLIRVVVRKLFEEDCIGMAYNRTPFIIIPKSIISNFKLCVLLKVFIKYFNKPIFIIFMRLVRKNIISW